MKYVIVLGDGMADRPIAELENKTPLEYAKILPVKRDVPVSCSAMPEIHSMMLMSMKLFRNQKRSSLPKLPTEMKQLNMPE